MRNAGCENKCSLDIVCDMLTEIQPPVVERHGGRTIKIGRIVPGIIEALDYDLTLREAFCPGATLVEEDGQIVACCNSIIATQAARNIHIPLPRPAES